MWIPPNPAKCNYWCRHCCIDRHNSIPSSIILRTYYSRMYGLLAHVKRKLFFPLSKEERTEEEEEEEDERLIISHLKIQQSTPKNISA